MKTIVLLISIVVFVSCQQGQKSTEQAKTPVTNVSYVETTVNIGGMHCENCVKSVEKGINELQGIAEVKVSLTDSTAFVKYDASKLKPEEINKAIETRGFKVKLNL